MTPLEKFAEEAQEVYDRVVYNYVPKKTNKPKM
jgi:hypothetical protein